MVKIRLQTGDSIDAPDGLTQEQYGQLVDDYLIPDKPESEPGFLGKAMDSVGMAALERAFGGANLGQMAADSVANVMTGDAGSIPAEFGRQVKSSIIPQLGKTATNFGKELALTGADALNIPAGWGLNAADKMMELAAPQTDYVDDSGQHYQKPDYTTPAGLKSLLDKQKSNAEYIEQSRADIQQETPALGSFLPELNVQMSPKTLSVEDLLQGKAPSSESPIMDVLKGAGKGVYDVGRGLATPSNLALLGAGSIPAAAKVLPAVFAPGMIKGIGEGTTGAYEDIKSGDYGTAAEKGAGALANALFLASMTKHALGGKTPSPTVKPFETSGKAPAPVQVDAQMPVEAAITPETVAPTLEVAQKPSLPETFMPLKKGDLAAPIQLKIPEALTPPTNAEVAATVEKAPKVSVKLPKELSGAKPRYSYGKKQYKVEFASDLDKAAYITAQKTPSRADAQYRAFLEKQGMTPEEIAQHGQLVRSRIKEMAKDGDPTAGPLKVEEITRTGTGGKLYGGIPGAQIFDMMWEKFSKSKEKNKELGAEKESEAQLSIPDTFYARSKGLMDEVRAEAEKARLDAKEQGAPESELPKIYENKIKTATVEQTLKRGFDPVGVEPQDTFSLGKIFKNKVNEYNETDSKLGTTLAPTLEKMVRSKNRLSNELMALKETETKHELTPTLAALRKSGISTEQVATLMQYVKSNPDGSASWDPTARIIKKGSKIVTDIPEYKGEMPSQDTFNKLAKLRAYLNDTYFTHVKRINPDVEFHDRFVPRQDMLPPEITGEYRENTIGSFDKTGASIESPSVTRHRSNAETGPREKDFVRIINRMNNQLAKHQAFADVLPDVRDNVLQLQALGLKSRAKAFYDSMAREMGMTPHELTELQRKEINKVWKESGSEAEVRKLLDKYGFNERTRDKIMHEINDMFYKTVIGMNVKLILAQTFQPELVGSVEVGLGRIIQARWHMLMRNKEDVAAYNKVKDRLHQVNYDPHEVTPEITENPYGKVTTGALNVVKAPGVPGVKTMNLMERVIRRVTFAAGRRQFLNNLSNAAKITEHLLPHEKQAIADAYKRGGKEAAAQEYGIIESFRTMQRFSTADKPTLLQNNALGRAIPFTTFTRSMLNLVAEDVKNRNYKMLAKRIAIPMAAAVLLGAGTATGNALIDGKAAPSTKEVFDAAAYYHPLAGIAKGVTNTASPLASLGSVGQGVGQMASGVAGLNPLKVLKGGINSVSGTPLGRVAKIVSKKVLPDGRKKASPKSNRSRR